MGKKANWILAAHWVIRPQDIPDLADRLDVSDEALCDALAEFDVHTQRKDVW